MDDWNTTYIPWKDVHFFRCELLSFFGVDDVSMLNPCGRDGLRKLVSFSYGFLPKDGLPTINAQKYGGMPSLPISINSWKSTNRYWSERLPVQYLKRWSKILSKKMKLQDILLVRFVDFGGLMVASALRKHRGHLQRNIVFWRKRHLDQWILIAKKGASKIKSNQRCHYSNPASFAEAVSGSIIIEEAPIQGGSIPKQEIPNGYVELWDDFQNPFSRTKMIWNTGRSNRVKFM